MISKADICIPLRCMLMNLIHLRWLLGSKKCTGLTRAFFL